MKPQSLFYSQKIIREDSSMASNTPRSKFHLQKKMSFNGVSFTDHLELNDEGRKCKTPGPKLLTSPLHYSIYPPEGEWSQINEEKKLERNPFLQKMEQIRRAKEVRGESKITDKNGQGEEEVEDPSRMTFRQIKKKSIVEGSATIETSN